MQKDHFFLVVVELRTFEQFYYLRSLLAPADRLSTNNGYRNAKFLQDCETQIVNQQNVPHFENGI